MSRSHSLVSALGRWLVRAGTRLARADGGVADDAKSGASGPREVSGQWTVDGRALAADGGTSRSPELGRYERIVEEMGDGVYALDRSGEVVQVNDRLLELTGYDREDMIGAHPELFLDEDDVEDFEATIEGLLDDDGGVGTVEATLHAASGETLPVEATITLRTTEDGEFRGIVGSVRDVTENKERERELERYETLLNTIPDTVTVTDLEGNHAEIHGFEGWVGYDREELIGEPIEMTTPERFVERGEEAVRELFTNDDVDKVTYESAVVTKDGEEIPHENHITLLPADEDGHVPGTLSVLRDISDRKEREAQLEALNAMMRDLVAAGSPEEIAEIVVETTSDVLGFDANLVVLHDAEENVLRPVAASARAEEVLEDFSPFEPGDTLPWQAYEAGEIRAYDDVGSAPGARNPDTPIETGVLCPLGDHGVLMLGSTETAEVDERARSLAENLARNVETALDRAEKQQALEAREEELELYELAVESTRDGIAVVDDETEYLVVNQTFAGAVGQTKDDFEGTRLVDQQDDAILDAPDDIEDRWIEAGREAYEEGESEFRFQTEIELEDGLAVLDNRVTAVRRDDDSVVFVMVNRDITDQKEIERQMERLHESTRELMSADSMEEVADRVIDAVETTLDFSGCLLRLVEDGHLVPVAVTDRARRLLEDPEPRSIADDALGEAFRRGEPIQYDDIREAGDDFEEANYRTLLCQPVGDYGLLSIVDEDVGAFDEADMRITEVLAANVEAALERVEREEALRDREQALARQNERLDQFAGIVSHDLRNPLNVAKGHLSFVLEETGDEHLEEVDHALDRMNDIINDVLALTREGDDATDPEPVALDATADACWRNVDTGEATLAVETDRVVAAEESRLQQLLENLFRNAIDHVGEDVRITVGDVEGGFYVEDDGPGIPPEDRDQVFDPGYSTEKGGTGLGLNIVETIADSHGWEVAVTEGSDGGARFEVTGVEVTDA